MSEVQDMLLFEGDEPPALPARRDVTGEWTDRHRRVTRLAIGH